MHTITPTTSTEYGNYNRKDADREEKSSENWNKLDATTARWKVDHASINNERQMLVEDEFY